MPLIMPPTSPQQKAPDIRITDASFVAPVTDSKVTNVNTLSGFAGGSKWVCDIYLQELRADTAPSSMIGDILPIHGQLREIRGFELIVDSPISYQQQSTLERGFSATGSAKVYPAVTPNEGDFFIADIGNGRNAIMLITKSERATIHLESMSVIDFKAIAVLTPELLNTVKERVIQSYIFDRDLLRQGLSALIKEADVDYLRRLSKVYRRLTNLYLNEFFDTSLRTLLVPGQGGKVYDPNMVRFVKRTMDANVCRKLNDVLELGTNHNAHTRVPTVLDAIETMDLDLLWSVGRRAGLMCVQEYKIHPHFYSIAYSGVDKVVTLYEHAWTNDTQGNSPTLSENLVEAGVKSRIHEHLLPAFQSGVAEPRPDNGNYIHPITIDTYYVFSKSFYDDEEGQSVLESILRNRMEQKPIDLKGLCEMAELSDQFDNLERYYYVPIILALIRIVPGVM